MARYLPKRADAKLGGEQTELLQISADERAARGADSAVVHRRGADAQSANRAAHIRPI